MAQCAVRLCEICEHSPGRQYCVNCEQYFCDNCKISHLKAKVSKTHKFEKADKVNPEIKIPKCEKHHEHFSFYCNTCTCLLCQICLTQNHKKHDFSLITEAVSRKKEDVKWLIQFAEKNTMELLTKVATLEFDLGENQECEKKIVCEIESKRKEMIEMVNTVADEYIAKVQQNGTKESHRIKGEIDKRKRAIQNDKVIIDATQSGDDVKFLATVFDIQNKLMSLQFSESCVNKFQYVKFTKTPTQKKDVKIFFGSLSIEEDQPITKNKVDKEEGRKVRVSGGNIKERSITKFKIGDRVKLKSSVERPKYMWGKVNHNSIGTVTNIDLMRNTFIVNFPDWSHWIGDSNELEYA